MQRDHAPGSWGGRADRGQSVFDFAIGISLFLVVVVAVLVFVPTAFGAFDDDSGPDPSAGVAADRVADFLVERGFADSQGPDGFSNNCVRDFFEPAGTGPICDYDFDADDASARVGLSEGTAVNVTVRAELASIGVGSAGLELLCWDDAGATYTSAGDSDCDPGPSNDDVVLSAGPSVADNEDYESTRRVGQLYGRTVYVTVRVW